MTAEGIQNVEIKNRTDNTIEYFVFHLYPTAFREGANVKPYASLNEAKCFPSGISFGNIIIKSVTINGEKSKHNIVGVDNDKLRVDLNKSLEVGDSVCVGIIYDLAIPNCTHRFGWFNDNINLANFYPVLSIFENGEYDMTPYYSTGDPFYSNCANYNVEIELDKNYSVFSSGEEKGKEIIDNKQILNFEAKAVRDFAFVIGKNFMVKTINTDIAKINYVGYHGDTNLEEMAELSKEALLWFSNNFFEYPYNEINVVKTPFVHGGMEYPGIVMISDTIEDIEQLEKVIVHEIAHEWWYGLVGVNETQNAWIDEGLSEYTTALFFDENSKYNITYKSIIDDALDSYILYADVIKSINGKINTKMNLPVNEYINEYD